VPKAPERLQRRERTLPRLAEEPTEGRLAGDSAQHHRQAADRFDRRIDIFRPADQRRQRHRQTRADHRLHALNTVAHQGDRLCRIEGAHAGRLELAQHRAAIGL
jgi:hypothetical protein